MKRESERGVASLRDEWGVVWGKKRREKYVMGYQFGNIETFKTKFLITK